MNCILNTNRIKQILLFTLFILGFACSNKEQEKSEFAFLRNNFPDVLDIHNTPKKPVDWTSFCFSDKGAWFGFALPDTNLGNNNISFAGPFLMTNGRWLSNSITRLKVYNENSTEIICNSYTSTYYPGKLEYSLNYDDFNAILSLIYISSDKALINVEFTGIKNSKIYPQWSGSVFSTEGLISSQQNIISIKKDDTEFNISFNEYNKLTDVSVSDSSYKIGSSPIDLSQNESRNLSMLISFSDDKSKKQNDELFADAIINPSKYLDLNQIRWDNYLTKALKSDAPWSRKKEYQIIAVKAVETLINNWRCAYGDLHHDGLFPSYAINYFNGFWAWDSWKHSVALAKFEPELAKNQIRTMYDYQDQAGMIADCIYADSSENNWLNTKPPLSAWAIWEIYKETKDTAFISEMYPKLIRYHEWWYKFRDLNKNKLCEYGSSDGSLVAAKWESGMDNAIRFDESAIIKIDESNYAFNQESVDLNSYLFFEKLFIVKMANLLADKQTADKYLIEASQLKELIETKMYDSKTGYYYDINIETEKIIPIQGPEGWIPLFTKVSSIENAESVKNIMLDTNKFNCYIPFPTAPKDDPKFSEGYWRGPIWLDQVYFAITALDNYGYSDEVDKYTLQVFDRLEGLKEQSPIRENYWPLNGEGMRVNHFSWSAAHLLLLYNQESQ
jgi:putative isomerase